MSFDFYVDVLLGCWFYMVLFELAWEEAEEVAVVWKFSSMDSSYA